MSFSLWAISIVCALFIGMAKTGINGLGTLVVPIMALAFGGMPSAGLVLPMLIMADIIGVWYYHRHASFKTLMRILPWAFLGLIAGLIAGKAISAEQFRHLIGWLMLLSMAILFWSEYRKRRQPNKSIPAWMAVPFGLVGGFSTMIGNAAGPVMSVYLLLRKLPKNEFIGTAAWFFFVINIVKLPMQIWGWHNIDASSLLFNLKMLPFIVLGAFFGIKLVKIISEKIYRWFIVIGTIISSLVLVFS